MSVFYRENILLFEMESLQVFWEESGMLKYWAILLLVLLCVYMYLMIRRVVIVYRGGKPLDKPEQEGVSVIITAHNNAEACGGICLVS